MVGVLDVGFVLAGLVLAFAGAAISAYAVALLGFVIGAAGGYVLAPQVLGEGLVGLAAVVLLGGVLGAALGYSALSFATAVPGFVVGAFVGLYIVSPLFLDGGLLRYAAAFAGGLVGAVLGFTVTKYALVGITAFVGGALASRSLTPAAFEAARGGFTVDPLLFDPFAPLFLGVLALGLLTQVGLFRLGWVAKLAAVLPGVGRAFQDGED
jgi:hypothetical protein